MNEQKQTKRDKAKKIGSYVLIGILVFIFLVSTLANAFTASASDMGANTWFDTSFTYEDGFMKNTIEYVPTDVRTDSYHIIVKDISGTFERWCDEDGVFDQSLCDILSGYFHVKRSDSDTLYSAANYITCVKYLSYDESTNDIFVFTFSARTDTTYISYVEVDFKGIFDDIGNDLALEQLSVIGIVVTEDAFPDHTVDDAISIIDDTHLVPIDYSNRTDLKVGYICNADYRVDYIPEKTESHLIWKLPARKVDTDFIEYNVVYRISDLKCFDLSIYGSNLSDYFYGVLIVDGAESEFIDNVTFKVVDDYFIASFKTDSFDRGYRYVAFNWSNFFAPMSITANEVVYADPVGMYVNYCNVVTNYPSVDNYITYAERVVVYGDKGAEKTQIKGFQKGEKFICDYPSVFTDNNGVTIAAQDIMVKGWLVVNCGVDYYSYTLKNGVHEITHNAINMFTPDFITGDVDKYGSDNGYVGFNYNAQYCFYISRLFDKNYRGTVVDSIEIVAHLYDGTEVTIFTLNDVKLSDLGGYLCGECGNRLIQYDDFVSVSHETHKARLYCDVCDVYRVGEFKHYSNDNSLTCMLCGGCIKFCLNFVQDVYTPVGLTYHERYSVCADCGKEKTFKDVHSFNSEKICTDCGYKYYTYASYDEGYADGYDKALTEIAYGIFDDVVVKYGLKYSGHYGDLSVDYLADNIIIDNSGICFSQYSENLLLRHNANVNKHLENSDPDICDDSCYDSIDFLTFEIQFNKWFMWQERMLTFNFEGDIEYLMAHLDTIYAISPDGEYYVVSYKRTGDSTYDIVLDDYLEQLEKIDAPIYRLKFTFSINTYGDVIKIMDDSQFSINSSVIVYGASNSYYNQGYADGLAQGEKEFDAAYEKGVEFGMEQGAKENYDLGYVDGFEKGQNSDNMFTTLFTGIFDSITLAFYSMLNFEILGVNVAMFALSLITLGLIIIVVKKFI